MSELSTAPDRCAAPSSRTATAVPGARHDRLASTRARVVLLLVCSFMAMAGVVAYVLISEWRDDVAQARERVAGVAEQIAREHRQVVGRADGVLGLLARSQTLRRFNFPADCQQALLEGRALWPELRNLAIARLDGDIVCDLQPSARVLNAALRPHFKRALATSDLAIGEVMTSLATGRQGLPFAKAIFAEDGRRVGVVMMLIELDWLSRELARTNLPTGSRIALIDSAGLIVARHPDPEGWIGQRAPQTELRKAIESGSQGVLEQPSMDGLDRIWAFTQFAQTAAGPIELLVGIPRDGVTDHIVDRVRTSLGLVLALLLFMLLVVWTTTARWFLRPVSTLAAAARRLKQGDLSARARIDPAAGELGELGRTFDAMAEAVESRERDLAASRRSLLGANRALRTLSACNHELVHAAAEPDLLDSICRVIVDKGGYPMAWVGYKQRDPAKTVKPVASAGDHGFVATAKVTWDDSEFGRGASGTAIRTGAVHINNDLLGDTATVPWLAGVKEHGYRANIALPLLAGADTFGALVIYAAEANAFNEAEVRLLEELAADLAFGILALRTKTERDRMSYENRHHEEILRLSLEGTVAVVAATAERRDPYTAGHQKRVSQLAAAIAKELALPEEQVEATRIASIVHDLGKIQVPAEILAKPTRLTALEYEMLKLHPEAGYEILKEVKFPWPIADIVRQHHERLDGSGYPHGLKGDEILLEARILAIADVVEAMASHRPYRPTLGLDAAFAEIAAAQGVKFDPAAVSACLSLFREGRFSFAD